MKTKQGKFIFGLVAVGVLTILIFSLMKGSVAPVPSTYIELSKLKGMDIQKIKGKYVLLHFWAKWCEPCADEIPKLVNFAETEKFSEPWTVLAVSLDSSLDDAKLILPNKGEGLPETFLLTLDPEHKVAEAMGSYQYPETYLLSPEGKILEKWVGPQKWQAPEVLEFFKQKIHSRM